MTNQTAAALIARSNRLGADPKNTNYAGGNTSAKGTETDPVTGEPVELLWVKGSGGDLGTLTESGLAVLRLDRMRALVDVYPGVDREDEMVAAFDYCLHGKGGAAPSIDTAMHGLVDAAHVDHLHPDSGIAFATAADGEELTRRSLRRQGRLGAVASPRLPARTRHRRDQGGEPAGDRLHPRRARHHGVGRRRATRPRATPVDHRRPPSTTSREHGRPEPVRQPAWRSTRRSPDAERRAKAAALAPTIRGLASHDKPMVGHFTDDPRVLDFLARHGGPAARRARHELPRPLPAHQGQAAAARPAGRRIRRGVDRPAEGAARGVPRRLPGVLRARTRRRTRPRSAAPTRRSCSCPGVGMFSYGANKQTARVAGEFYVNAINVMRGAEALSTYSPDRRRGEVPHRVLGARGGQAAADAEAEAARDPHRARHRRGIRNRQGHRDPPRRRGRLRRHRRPRPREGAGRRRRARVDGCRDRRRRRRRRRRPRCRPRIDATVLAFGGIDLVVNNAGLSLSKPLLETTEKDWDLQHDVMAKGSFLVSKAAAKVLIEQGLGGDIIYISSKNSVFAGPNNIAYSATKADQAHQVRLLAVELGEHGVRVNGINPDGVVRGSGIFAGGWGANRAAVYGVRGGGPRQVLRAAHDPQARGAARERRQRGVRALPGRTSRHTTGLHIPVDAGVAAAFLR